MRFQSLLSGMKLLERNSAVLGQIVFVSDYLSRPPGLFTRHVDLTFGKQISFRTEVGIIDREWLQKEEDGGKVIKDGSEEATPPFRTMKVIHLEEPELEFGVGRHIDIRFGLRNYGPLDYAENTSPKQINLGIVGTAETTQGVLEWLERCRHGIQEKPSNQPHLFSAFPGFTVDDALQSVVCAPSELQGHIATRIFKDLKDKSNSKAAVEKAVEAFLAEIEAVSTKNVHVIVCAPPVALIQAMNIEEFEAQSGTGAHCVRQPERVPDFHDLLKAKAMKFGKPIQIVLPGTYDESKRKVQKRNRNRLRTNQDEATRAWNFHVALYYKAGGIPWRLVRHAHDYTACFVGICFYQSVDKSSLLTSVAQVFNERGEGMAVRGSAAFLGKDDLQIHLPAEGAYSLLNKALKDYGLEHHNIPARVVLHKSSTYSSEERAGFDEAAKENRLHSLDLISMHDSGVRLFRAGAYPPLRGTLLQLDEKEYCLYTRGSVDFFRTYPGMYVPQSLGIRFEETDQGRLLLTKEILALTKMNWNNTQFDGYEPITLSAARKVGHILKHLNESESIQTRYSFYM